MYLAGLSGGGTNAFSAAGQASTDGSNIVCSNNADLSNPLFGSACFSYTDNSAHTYWGNAALDMNWALYTGGAPYTLRHCNMGWDGVHDTGSIWYKRSTAALPSP
jgi:hypothetical protein